MTDRDEKRKECIEAMEAAYLRNARLASADAIFSCVFDALNGIVRVCSVEATEEMLDKTSVDDPYRAFASWCFNNMSDAGDLTNPPETKP